MKTFLVRFSSCLVTVPYPGYSLVSVLKGIDLPKLYRPQYTVGGIMAYLKVSHISQATFVARVKRYSLKIKTLVLKYQVCFLYFIATMDDVNVQ